MTFSDMRLIAPLLGAVRQSGYETPTPIQQATIPWCCKEATARCTQTGTADRGVRAAILQRLIRTRASRRRARARSGRWCSADPRVAMQSTNASSLRREAARLTPAVIFAGSARCPNEQLKRGGTCWSRRPAD